MVHALRQAHEVLRPNGVVVDVRPGAVHRRVSVVRPNRYQYVATMRESLADDRAADRAVAIMLRKRIFRRGQMARFDCRRVFDSIDELRDWLTEEPPYERILRKLEHHPAIRRPGARIVIRGPIVVQTLVRVD
ncbi:MAG TPA: hypothetical protein VFI11_12385 [Anaerolineales bacterium]|nr:hypothetical protein [Anaerolineales bacterium]